MSRDPFDFQKTPGSYGFGDSAFGGAGASASFPGSAAQPQAQPPAQSVGWVSFDDDGGSGFSVAPPPPAPLTTAPAPAPPTAGAAPPLGSPPGKSASLSWPAFQGISSQPSAPGAASTGTAGPGSGAAAPSPLLHDSGLAAALAPMRGGSLGPGSGAPGSAAPGSRAADPSTLPIHRLPRPPIFSKAVPPAASTPSPAGGTSPVAALALTAGHPSSVSSCHLAVPGAPRKTLDPFAELSLKPQLPRPPPMAATKGPATHQAAALPPSPGTGLPGPGSVGTVPDAARDLSPPATLPELGTDTRTQTPPGPSFFPSFTNLHQQATAPSPQGSLPGAATGASLAKAPGAPQASGGAPQVTGFDAFGSVVSASDPSASSSSSLNGRAASKAASATAQTAAAAARSPDRPPPPPYSLAVGMSSPSTLPSSPPPYDLLLAASTSPKDLPPPPPYVDALEMPQAQPQTAGQPPPPSYEEAFGLPSAESRPRVPHPPATAFDPGAPLIPELLEEGSWANFDVSVFGAAAATGMGGSAAVVAAAAASPVGARSGQHSPRGRSGFGQQAMASQPSPPQPLSIPEQICVEVRLPPLKPKEAACPRRLAAGMGMAFAAPGGEGVAALQWHLQPGHPGFGHGSVGAAGGARDGDAGGHREGMEARFVLPAGVVPRTTEDWDSAPAAALSAPASELPTSCCMVLDDVNGHMWTGHKDGRVVRWNVLRGRPAVLEHQWKAHIRGKIMSLALSPWGDLWTASSAGTIRAWGYPPGATVTRQPTRLFECRRTTLRLNAAARATAQRAHSKARLLALGPSGRVVWSAGRSALALWGAYDGEFLGTITPGQPLQDGLRGNAPVGVYAGDTGSMMRDSGQQQQQPQEINTQTGLEAGLINRAFLPRQLVEVPGGEEGEAGADLDQQDLGQQVIKGLAGAAKLAAKLGKKIRQNFASDAVGGGADLYGPNDPGSGPGLAGGGSRGKVAALFPGLHQHMYVAYRNGVLEKYTEWGRLVWTRDYGRGFTLHSGATVGSLVWLGCGDGVLRTASSASGELLRSWKAHDFPVVSLAHDSGGTGRGSGLVYSLSKSGSVRAWPAVLPSPDQRLAWRDDLLPCLRRHQLAVMAATWNVNETRPTPQSLRKWLEPAATTEIVSIALQEVEVGTGSVARDAAITLLSKAMLERGNQNAQWWATELAAALAATKHHWTRVALRQMSGLVIVVFCRTELLQHVGEVATANVACGVMGVGGNKGAVAVSMSVFRRRLMFVSSHFAAHQERVDERNDNYNKIVRQLHFDNTSKAAMRQHKQQQQLTGGLDGAGDTEGDATDREGGETTLHRMGSGQEEEDDGHGPGMSDAAMLVWSGDFNYRINGSYKVVCEMACAEEYEKLYAWDQCRAEVEKGTIFRGLKEPLPLGYPVFVPTYKFDKNEPHKLIPPSEPFGKVGLRLPYDTSEKERVPAWTDRVFYRGSRLGSLDVAEEEVQVTIARPQDYNCVLEVTDSDHKPVYALLQVQLPAYKQEEKRRHSLASALAVHIAALSGAAAKQPSLANAASPQPVQLSISRLEIRGAGVATAEVVNTAAASFHVQVRAERLHDGIPCHLPTWLEVSPTSFALSAGEGTAAAAGAAGLGGEYPDAAPGRTRIVLRALPADAGGSRGAESVNLRFALLPLWGADTRAGVVGPAVQVTLRP